jgi:hypothetical protein
MPNGGPGPGRTKPDSEISCESSECSTVFRAYNGHFAMEMVMLRGAGRDGQAKGTPGVSLIVATKGSFCPILRGSVGDAGSGYARQTSATGCALVVPDPRAVPPLPFRLNDQTIGLLTTGIEVEDHQVFQLHAKEARQGIIQDEWIVHVVQFPEKTEVQFDGRIRKWGWISEEGKFPRVILLEDGETIHNAFFDRSFGETQQ